MSGRYSWSGDATRPPDRSRFSPTVLARRHRQRSPVGRDSFAAESSSIFLLQAAGLLLLLQNPRVAADSVTAGRNARLFGRAVDEAVAVRANDNRIPTAGVPGE